MSYSLPRLKKPRPPGAEPCSRMDAAAVGGCLCVARTAFMFEDLIAARGTLG